MKVLQTLNSIWSQSKFSLIELPSFLCASSSKSKNASERINLQDIMQLRTAFITADDSGDGELSLNEVSPIGCMAEIESSDD